MSGEALTPWTTIETMTTTTVVQKTVAVSSADSAPLWARYAAYVAHSGVLSPGETATVFWTTVVVVMVSIVVYGVSAAPLTRRLLGRAPEPSPSSPGGRDR